MNKNLVNLFGLAKELHLPVGWLKGEALAGRIPCLKIGRRLRFNPEAVRGALSRLATEERKRKPTVLGGSR